MYKIISRDPTYIIVLVVADNVAEAVKKFQKVHPRHEVDSVDTVDYTIIT